MVVVFGKGLARAVAAGFHAEQQEPATVGKDRGGLPGLLGREVEGKVARDRSVGIDEGGMPLGGEEDSHRLQMARCAQTRSKPTICFSSNSTGFSTAPSSAPALSTSFIVFTWAKVSASAISRTHFWLMSAPV